MFGNSFFSVEQMRHEIDAVCIENALIDMLIHVTEDQLKDLGMTKGVMQLVDRQTQHQILEKLHGLKPEVELGGSASNAMRGMAILGGNTVYSSSVGQDTHGDVFSNRLGDLKIGNRLSVTNEAPTGISLVAITPDKERTMNTFLGACRSYQKEDVPFDDIRKAKLFFSTGYMLDTQNQIDALHAALDFALLNDVKIAFDVADPFVIVRHGKQTILDLLQKTHLVFANSHEAQMLVGCQGEKAALEISKIVQYAVVKDAGNGAYVAHNDEVTYVPAQKVSVADTTGAGDMFAGGFMYGLCKGLPLSTCGEIATILASDTIQHVGVRLSQNIYERVKTNVKGFK